MFVLVPFFFLPARMNAERDLANWRAWAAICSVLCGLAGTQLLFRHPKTGRVLLGFGLAAFAAAMFPILLNNPFAALFAGALVFGGGFYLVTGRISVMGKLSAESARKRAQCGLGALATAAMLSPLASPDCRREALCFAVSGTIAAALLFVWGIRQNSRRVRAAASAAVVGTCALLWLFFFPGSAKIFLFLLCLGGIALLSFLRAERNPGELWWSTFLLHPARNLFLSFLGLIAVGTLLLRTSVATANGIPVVDAAFCAVSAVCVTGLSTIDIASELTGAGQLFLLILIQLGGLGIMSVTTLALHALGRLSLNQEKLMHSMIQPDESRNLFLSLLLILKFTFAAEFLGATILFFCFLLDGTPVLHSAWLGAFLSISAFCNAGFFPHAENLAVYADHPVLLHTVAALIILGGMAPTTALALPRWLARKPVPLAARLALGTTLFLLIFGALLLLIFEWNGVFNGLSFSEKLTHAWFQSTTLRTAGFNSVPLAALGAPSVILMLLLMFIGGSPGGTAGGVKTTTAAMLALSFRAAATGRETIISHGRRIPGEFVIQAVAIVIASFLFLLLTVLMLLVTQDAPAKDLVFEATSALGTVGLTLGATTRLDEIGKLAIMMAMFVGRIGPLTFFLILREKRASREPIVPDARIMIS